MKDSMLDLGIYIAYADLQCWLPNNQIVSKMLIIAVFDDSRPQFIDLIRQTSTSISFDVWSNGVDMLNLKLKAKLVRTIINEQNWVLHFLNANISIYGWPDYHHPELSLHILDFFESSSPSWWFKIVINSLFWNFYRYFLASRLWISLKILGARPFLSLVEEKMAKL